MKSKHIPVHILLRWSLLILLLPVLAGCQNLPYLSPSSDLVQQPDGEAPPEPREEPGQPETPQTQVTFQVRVPSNSPADAVVYLSIVDEVTGLAFNSEQYPMQAVEMDEGSAPAYSLDLILPVGSTIKYRYLRQAGASTVLEHLSDGRPVRYRLYHVEGPGSVEDVVGRWTDTSMESDTGRIRGTALDESGAPIPGLLVSAGGAQTFTAHDGFFLIEGLPEGVHNLVGVDIDGAHRTFQQGARVAVQSTTPATITLPSASYVQVTFQVELPEDTPPVIPVRIAGNLYSLGNTFGNLSGGLSSLAERMPILSPDTDGLYSLTLSLPVGIDLRYKYTLGDGFWNAEHAEDGDFLLRQLIVPEADITVQDKVATWSSGGREPITFDLHLPDDATTPGPEEQISIRLSLLLGPTPPLPMWQLAKNRYAYILHSPLNIPGGLSYVYCRNGACEADSRPLNLETAPGAVRDELRPTISLPEALEPVLPDGTQPRSTGFMAGVSLGPRYNPALVNGFPQVLNDLEVMNANMVSFMPTWTFTRKNLPVMEVVPVQDPLWQEVLLLASQAKTRGFQVFIYPQPHFPEQPGRWWNDAARDYPWWVNWFDRYRIFVLHHAAIAEQSGSLGFVLGGDWVSPAMPGGSLEDGSPSGLPADAESRWRSIISEVRTVYSGSIYWAWPSTRMVTPPPFLDAVDGIYLHWSNIPEGVFQTPDGTPERDPGRLLDIAVRPIQLLYAKPMIMAVYAPAQPDVQTQADVYNQLAQVVNQRDWIVGFISQGYLPPEVGESGPGSVYGRPAWSLLAGWYHAWSGE